MKRLAARREEIEDQVVYGIAGPVSWLDAVVSWSPEAQRALGDRSYVRYLSSLRQVRAHLDSLSIQEITTDVLKELIKARKRAGVKNATVRRDLTAVSSVLNHAVDEGWISENPSEGINRRRVVPERQVRIVLPREDMMAIVFPRLADRIRDVCDFTRETGLRLDEASSMKHAAVDRTERTITVEEGKGDKVRTVPLTATAEQIIDRQPRYIGKPWVFWQDKGERLKEVSSRITGACRRAAQKATRDGVEFQGFSHHDFRHLFAVEYLRRGRGSIYDLQGEMGHTHISTTEGYLAFLTPEQARAAKSSVAQRGAHQQRFGAERA
ncbi:tyrosine-type recombinase/integrase [Sphingomonas bacterium]|uniref:tyrosine-type recombinase/integrase n=1 Tax=Sphingomonas bacterium TaxID=1895847 RepID=UPI0015751420|nr:site-specific integrase [Sphingomonas bacterium]